MFIPFRRTTCFTLFTIPPPNVHTICAYMNVITHGLSCVPRETGKAREQESKICVSMHIFLLGFIVPIGFRYSFDHRLQYVVVTRKAGRPNPPSSPLPFSSVETRGSSGAADQGLNTQLLLVSVCCSRSYNA